MSLTLIILFWISLGSVILTYIAYPLILLALRPLVGGSLKVGNGTPSVTLVVSAFNESAVIRQKLENSLSLDYPEEKLEILVISDESNDGTDEIVASYAGSHVRLFRQEPRRGKSLGLSRFVPAANGEILVFSDANSMYRSDALRMLVRHFEDEQVGFVAGHQRYAATNSQASDSESLYWRYETFLKILETHIGSVVCGDGAIYAMRAALFEPMREDDINDFYLPLRIIARGHRGIFDAEAVCYEETAEDFSGEFRRKIRIVNRSLRAVSRVPQALNPFAVGFFAFQLAVHKVLRWFVPFLLVAMLTSSALLATMGSRTFASLLGLQFAAYAIAGCWFVPGLRRLRIVYVAYYFCLVNAAAAIGIIQFFLGKRVIMWTPHRSETKQVLAD